MTIPTPILTWLRANVPIHLHPRIDREATFETLQLDALAAVELALLIEDETNMPGWIGDAELQGWACIGDVVDAFEARVRECLV